MISVFFKNLLLEKILYTKRIVYRILCMELFCIRIYFVYGIILCTELFVAAAVHHDNLLSAPDALLLASTASIYFWHSIRYICDLSVLV